MKMNAILSAGRKYRYLLTREDPFAPKEKLQEPQIHGRPESEHFNELAERLRTESSVNYTVDATRTEGEGTGRRNEARASEHTASVVGAAARAVIFAQMVDDPSGWPNRFPTEKVQEEERRCCSGSSRNW